MPWGPSPECEWFALVLMDRQWVQWTEQGFGSQRELSSKPDSATLEPRDLG